jgi:hypothetical protein
MKGVIRSHQSKKGRHYNDQKKKDKTKRIEEHKHHKKLGVN